MRKLTLIPFPHYIQLLLILKKYTMLKNISKLGVTLSKEEQQKTNGGSGFCIPHQCPHDEWWSRIECGCVPRITEC